MQVDVNYWAVLVCGVASMVIGFLYYGPIFGKSYSRLMGFDKLSDEERRALMKGMGGKYLLAFVGALVMAYVLAHFLVYSDAYTGAAGVSGGLQAGFWAWLGFIAPVTLGNTLWGRQSWKLWVMSNVYYVVQLLVFGAILGSWR